MSDIANFIGGGTPSSSNESFWKGFIPWISSSDIKENNVTDITITRFITENAVDNSATKICSAPVILLVSRVGVGKIALSYNKICTSQDFCNLIDIKCNPLFLTYNLSKIMIRKSKEVQGTSIKGITSGEIQKIHLSIPNTEKEQEKVANILSLIDARIATQNKIIDNLKTLIKGLTLNLQQNGLKEKTWKKQYLREVLIESKKTNKNGYKIYSVSVSQGIINQIDYLGRSFAAKDTSNYHVVNENDIVYTKSPTGEFPYGIVKQSTITNAVAVSPLYGVYSPKNNYIGTVLHYYFINPNNANGYLHPLIQKGAKNTINITNQHFLDNAVVLPTNKETAKLSASALLSIQNKISLCTKLLHKFESQKQHLLQQMFI